MMDDGTMSMTSFNQGLYEQFRNLDSISQIGDNSQIHQLGYGGGEGEQSLDLGAVKEQLFMKDQKIKELQGNRTKLKTLLKKAKDALDS